MKILLVLLTGSIFYISFISNYLINAEQLNRTDYEITPIEFIRNEGYEAEEHKVITEDGYVLTLHRIPGKTGSAPVFLQHGILLSSFEWIISGQDNNSLAFVLADHGYDVWLGNARGNAYSREHINRNLTDRQFWNFSWHEMGVYDLPAVMSYITNLKNESLIYIGHSMGTTMFFVMASEKPEVAKAVKVMFGMAPVAFFHYSNYPLFLLKPIDDTVEMFFESLGIYQILPPDTRKFLASFAEENCYKKELLNENNICVQMLVFLGGGDASRFNHEILPLLASHAAKGSSVKTFQHYLQVAADGYFRKYNYGTAKNLEIYNSYEPPNYNLSKIQVPVGLLWAEKDTYFSHPLDVKKLDDLLPHKILNYKIPNPDFTHMDFAVGLDNYKYVYPKLLSVMEDYR